MTVYAEEMQINSSEDGQEASPKLRLRLAYYIQLLVPAPSPVYTCNYLFPPGSAQVLLIPFQECAAYVFPRIKSLPDL